MLLKVIVEVPDDLELSREDLSSILATVMYAPDKALTVPLKPKKRKPITQSEKYDSGRYEGVHTFWKATK